MKNSEERPANFILKLSNILRSKEHAKVISWDHQEQGIRIHNQQKLEKVILPRFFRHNKYASFVRQLNMYDFHKINFPDHTSIFCHPTFNPKKQTFSQQNKEDIHLIKRKSTLIHNQVDLDKQNEKIKLENIEQFDFKWSFKGPSLKNKSEFDLNPEKVLQELISQLASYGNKKQILKSKIGELRINKKFRKYLKSGSFMEKLYARLGIQMDNNQDKLSELSIQQQLMFKTKKSFTQKSLKMYESGPLNNFDTLGHLFN